MRPARTPADRRRLVDLGQHLQRMGEMLGLSRAELAHKARLSVSTVKHVERAKYTPTRVTLVRVLDALQQPEEQRRRLMELLPSEGPRCHRCDRPLVCPCGCPPRGPRGRGTGAIAAAVGGLT